MATHMSWQNTYRDSQVGGATPIGLIVALFDRLVTDLARAADAIRRGEIERRCRELNHGFVVLGQLESWLDFAKGGELARQIALFYAQIRTAMMDASATQRDELLDEQIRAILHVRSAWHLLDTARPSTSALHAAPISIAAPGLRSQASRENNFSQSA